MHLWLVLTNRTPRSESVPVLRLASERTGSFCFLNHEHLLWGAWTTLRGAQLSFWSLQTDGPLGCRVTRKWPETTWGVREDCFNVPLSLLMTLATAMSDYDLSTVKPPSRVQSTHRIVRENKRVALNVKIWGDLFLKKIVLPVTAYPMWLKADQRAPRSLSVYGLLGCQILGKGKLLRKAEGEVGALEERALKERRNCSPVSAGADAFGPMVPMLFYRF